MTKQTNVTGYYATFFKAWQAKLVGPQPTADMLAIASAFCGHGTPGKQCLALAMALRPVGVTAGHMNIVCGAPQHNFRRGLITEGLLKAVPMPKNEQGHTVYRVELTAKGKVAVTKAAKPATASPAAAKPVKPATPRKPRVKAPVVTPAVDVPQADTPAPAVTA